MISFPLVNLLYRNSLGISVARLRNCGTLVPKIPLNPPFSKGEVYIFSFPPFGVSQARLPEKGEPGGILMFCWIMQFLNRTTLTWYSPWRIFRYRPA
jgi:hypothetical protein